MQISLVKIGRQEWNRWRSKNPDVSPDLSGIDFKNINVSGLDLRQADLRGANLSKVIGLQLDNLAGADLSGAKLPPGSSEFPALEQVARVSGHARVNFLAVIGSCAFCWLTIAQTTDAALITNQGVTKLPIITTEVPITVFFYCAPIILLALYVYLQLYLQRMWDGLSKLPAFFPDGTRLEQKAYPWLLSGLVSVYFSRLQRSKPPFAKLQFALSAIAAWCLVPFTIFLFWIRYLLFSNNYSILPHVLYLALSIAAAFLFYRSAYVSLRRLGKEVSAMSARQDIPAPMMVCILALCASVAATYGVWASSILWHLELEGEEIRSEIEIEQLKSKMRHVEELALIDLRAVHFPHADGRNASLVRVDFTGADLSNSNFDGADLRGAVLTDANLTNARFVGANLKGARLFGVQLNGAEFTAANGVKGSMFINACGDRANIYGLPDNSPLRPSCGPAIEFGSTAEPDRGSQKGAELRGGMAEPLTPDCEMCPELVLVPAGAYIMGSPESEEGRFLSEGPQHGVIIDKPFAVGRYEVTFSQYHVFVEETKHDYGNSCWTHENGDWSEKSGRSYKDNNLKQDVDHPVVCVSWHDANAYVRWLSDKTGKSYRLLSEAEWEYAARAGTTTPYAFTNGISSQNANYDGNEGGTTPITRYPGNSWHLHDMHGNVWEWTSSCWTKSYRELVYSDAETTGKVSHSSGNKVNKECDRAVVRGGAWDSKARNLRSADRNSDMSVDRNDVTGFRVAREVVQEDRQISSLLQ